MKTKFTFRDLEVWEKSMAFAKDIYILTKSFPREEIYGLSSQLRRATSSIALNIAEGRGRYSRKEFLHFLYISRASLFESMTCLELSTELKYIQEKTYKDLEKRCEIINSMLGGLIGSIKSKIKDP